jgi:hypothetical protein
MKEIDRLMSLLFPVENGSSKTLDLKFFHGEQPVTVEEFCKEAHSGFVQVDSGQSKMSVDFVENLLPVHVDKFLATA